jgi:hypothetical protein
LAANLFPYEKYGFFWRKVFLSFRKWTKINVQKWEFQNSTWEKYNCVTIIEFFGVDTEKIIFILLP